jgi:methylglutaconyl-CoA hydratase
MLLTLDRLPQAVVGRIHGAAIAGGGGLVAVCDVAIAAEGTQFGFSEVRLGIVPAIISPFVVAKIGFSAARELFVTGVRFDALRAHELGLVHRVVAPAALDTAVAEYVAELLTAAPGAVAAAKHLLRELQGRSTETAIEVTSAVIAERRLSSEGRAGIQAFLSKTTPPWKM